MEPASQQSSVSNEFPFTAADFRTIVGIVYDRSGIVLAAHKRDMTYSRLARRVRALGLRSFRDYCALLRRQRGRKGSRVSYQCDHNKPYEIFPRAPSFRAPAGPRLEFSSRSSAGLAAARQNMVRGLLFGRGALFDSNDRARPSARSRRRLGPSHPRHGSRYVDVEKGENRRLSALGS